MSRFDRDPEHVSDALGAYALGALPEDEMALVDAHLATCGECRAEGEALRSVVIRLGDSPPRIAPPPELKGRIMAEVEREASLMRAAAGERADEPEPSFRRLRFGGLALRPLALGLGCAALLAVGVAGFLVGDSVHHGGSRAAIAATTIPATVHAPGARAALVRRGDNVALVVSNLPSPPRGRVYQVWLQPRGRRGPVPTDALFTVNARGNAHVAVPGDLRRAQAVLVTNEPPGGSTVPSQLQPLIAAPIS